MRSTELMPRSILPLAAVAMLLMSACGDKNKSEEVSPVVVTTDSASRAAIADSATSIEVVPSTAPAAQEPPVAGRQPVPAVPAKATTPRPKPSTPRPSSSGNSASNSPAPAPAGPSVSSGTVASGTTIRVSSGEKVCSNSLAVGDRVTATTNSLVSGSNGVSIPAGARVGLVVTESKTSSRQGDDAKLTFDVRSVTFGGETYTMSGSVSTDAVVTERKGGDGKKVAIGAAAGAVIGNIIGGGSRAQRTVVGAAAGGAAGAVAAAVTGDRLACLPEGSPLTVTLGSALTVKN